MNLTLLADADLAGGNWTTLWFYVGLALGVSFICSVLEAVLLTTRRPHLEMRKLEGDAGAIVMGHLKSDLDQAISAILTLNTVAHTLGAAGAGAEAAKLFSSQSLGLFSAILTLAILFLSEIIPKTIGAIYWKPLMGPSAYTIRVLIWILYPIVWLSQAVTRALKPKNQGPTVTRAEIEILAQISRREGALDQRELEIIGNLFQLATVRVSDVLTPRTVVFALPQHLTVAEARTLHTDLTYSRIPLFTKHVDDANTFVLRHDLLGVPPEAQETTTLKSLSRPLISVPPDLSIARVLDRFVAEQEHIFVVIDEYGGTEGIITLEDSIETLLGSEIIDESDITVDLRDLAQQRRNKKLARLASTAQPHSPDKPQSEPSQ